MSGVFKDFCEELKSKSAKIHETSDRLVQLKLAVVLTDTKLYCKVLGDFYCLFQAIETAVIKNKENEYLKDLWIDDLARSKKFEEDLEFFSGLGWREFVKPSDTVLHYVSHIEELSATSPVLLIAYIHTMYLAIFSGGFIIRRIVKNTLGLAGEDGLSVFDLPPGTSRNGIKKHIKSSINKLTLDRDTKDKTVQEKISIFRRNNDIVRAVKPRASSYKRIAKLLAIILFIFAMLSYLLFIW